MIQNQAGLTPYSVMKTASQSNNQHETCYLLVIRKGMLNWDWKWKRQRDHTSRNGKKREILKLHAGEMN